MSHRLLLHFAAYLIFALVSEQANQKLSRELPSDVCERFVCERVVTEEVVVAQRSLSEAQDQMPEHLTFQLDSKELNETRTLCVWLPPVYSQSKDNFPVLYMPDGGLKEDFPHIANTVAKLVATAKIPACILVGIENTQRRRDLTGPSEVQEEAKIAPISDGASKFRAFIRNELFPEVDRRFRTTKSRSIIGESAAGLFIVETLMLNPDMFDNYIAMDPAIYWNNRYLVRSAKSHLAKFSDSKKKFWFAGSNATDIYPNTRELRDVLTQAAPASLTWNYLDQPNEKHNTIFRATKERALLWTFSPAEIENR
ncbi:MAG: alpha/beta hydrolase-fold protein [Planctomycetota bacterium]